MVSPMKPAHWIFLPCALALALSGCGGIDNPDVVTGPFDENGNYREEWADNPSKWRKSGGSPSPHERKSDELPKIAANDQPPQNSVPLVSSGNTGSSQVISNPTPPKKTVVKPKPKPKPTPVKVKPKSTRYVVKKGDTLSAIASRNGSSVSAIQRASGVKGSLIRPGQVLTIPLR